MYSVFKKCSSCQKELEEQNFSNAEWIREAKQGRRCKECVKLKNQRYHAANKQRQKALHKDYYEKNKAMIRKRHKANHFADRKNRLEKSKEYQQKNKVKLYNSGWAGRILKTYGITVEQYDFLLKSKIIAVLSVKQTYQVVIKLNTQINLFFVLIIVILLEKFVVYFVINVIWL